MLSLFLFIFQAIVKLNPALGIECESIRHGTFDKSKFKQIIQKFKKKPKGLSQNIKEMQYNSAKKQPQ